MSSDSGLPQPVSVHSGAKFSVFGLTPATASGSLEPNADRSSSQLLQITMTSFAEIISLPSVLVHPNGAPQRVQYVRSSGKVGCVTFLNFNLESSGLPTPAISTGVSGTCSGLDLSMMFAITLLANLDCLILL